MSVTFRATSASPIGTLRVMSGRCSGSTASTVSRYPSTPEVVSPVWLPVRVESGSLDQTAAWATRQGV
jgi:hypothetical protein